MNREIALQEELGDRTEYTIKQETLVIRFRCDVDHHNALQIRREADRLLEHSVVRNIVFDFTGVQFMDSSGIGMIMGRYKKVIFTGGKIAVSGVGSEVDRILLISGLYRVMSRYDTVEDALQNIGKKQPGKG